MRGFLASQPVIFPPEVIEILVAALDEAWSALVSSTGPLVFEGSRAEAREILAKSIIASAAQGERDAARLREDALAELVRTTTARGARKA